MDETDGTECSVRNALRGEVRDLPPALHAAFKLLRLTRDETTAVASISRVIETEPALAAKILRIVNSAFYGLPHRIQNIPRAVTVLGFSAVRQVALHLLFYDGLVNRGQGRAFNRAHFWQHSLLVAILSRGLAEHLEHPDPDSLYAAGLLHDLGKMVLESHGRVSYSDFLNASANSGNAIREDERTFFGVTHDAVGAYVCQVWGLPEIVCLAQARHHCSISGIPLSARQLQEIAMVALADFIAWTQGIGSAQRLGSPDLAPGVLEALKLERIDLSGLLEKADAEIQDIGNFYGFQFPSTLQLRANLVTAAIDLSRVRTDQQSVATGQNPSIHTLPHRSLDPDEFIPQTLAALQKEFGYRRLLMMQVEASRRSLVATHAFPETTPRPGPRELMLPALSGDLVRSFREHRPVVLRDSAENAPLLSALGVAEAAAVPVMSHGRLLGVLWVYQGRDNALLEIGPLQEVQRVAGELGIALERSQAFAVERAKAEMDALTRLRNRSAVDRHLQQSFRQADKTGQGFVLGLVDIDHFKRFNDSFGHQTGDDVLRIVADTLRSLTRPNDFLGRYGGEEFLFLLQDTDQRGGLTYAERIRAEIERRGLILSTRFPGHALTVSIGVCVYHARFRHPGDMLGEADRALYRAKESGRNRVVAASDLPPHQPESNRLSSTMPL